MSGMAFDRVNEKSLHINQLGTKEIEMKSIESSFQKEKDLVYREESQRRQARMNQLQNKIETLESFIDEKTKELSELRDFREIHDDVLEQEIQVVQNQANEVYLRHHNEIQKLLERHEKYVTNSRLRKYRSV